MNWIVARVLASVAGASAPLLMVESVSATHGSTDLGLRRRRLWSATLIAVCLLLAWLYVDRSAVAAGPRSLAVTVAAASTFAILFSGLAYPALRVVQAAAPRQASRWVPVFRVRADVPVLFLCAAALAGAMISPNDLGYRLKGAGMVLAALTLYFLGRPRAPRTFLAFVGAAAITLFAKWEDPWQRTIGIASQLAVGALGFVWCARLLTRPDRAA